MEALVQLGLGGNARNDNMRGRLAGRLIRGVRHLKGNLPVAVDSVFARFGICRDKTVVRMVQIAHIHRDVAVIPRQGQGLPVVAQAAGLHIVIMALYRHGIHRAGRISPGQGQRGIAGRVIGDSAAGHVDIGRAGFAFDQFGHGIQLAFRRRPVRHDVIGLPIRIGKARQIRCPRDIRPAAVLDTHQDASRAARADRIEVHVFLRGDGKGIAAAVFQEVLVNPVR